MGQVIYFLSLSIMNKINVYSQLIIFPLYFTKFSLNRVSIRVKFGSSKGKRFFDKSRDCPFFCLAIVRPLRKG